MIASFVARLRGASFIVSVALCLASGAANAGRSYVSGG